MLALHAALARADGHLTGEWGGIRSKLDDKGLTLDLIYVAETYHTDGHTTLHNHADAALTVGPWYGAKLFVLAQVNRGDGINADVGSAAPVSNLESDAPYTQITEALVEQTIVPDRLFVRIGKQDANRDFGTPRYGGNFINGNFGMFPCAPLPSYPNPAVGVAAVGKPVDWLDVKLAGYEDSIVAGGISATRHYGEANRDEGVTSLAVWHQSGDQPDVVMPDTTHAGNTGFLFQHDEHVFLHPENKDDPRGLNVILRFGWAQSDRTAIARFADVSLAWHGIGPRANDTVGVGGGGFTVGAGDEEFLEAFYKARLTSYFSLQPDLELYRHPGASTRDAVVVGGRVKVKL